MSKIPKGATHHRVVECDGAKEQVSTLYAIPAKVLDELYAPRRQQPMTEEARAEIAAFSKRLPDGEYWFVNGVWVPA